jgi:glutathione S-transferase
LEKAMVWVDLVTLLAVLQFFGFMVMVGTAREKYGVKAPAVSGNLEFERYFRVQQNTLETLIMFLPALWIAAHYFNPLWTALIGAIYLLGRLLYFQAYVRDPGTRTVGYVVSIAPVAVLVAMGLIGIVRAIVVG